MRLTCLTFLCLIGFSALAAPARATTDVTAILVTASRQPGDSDRRLAPYEATLRRILRFESFKFVGQDRGTVPDDGDTTLNVGAGQSLAIAPGDGNQLAVTWRQGGRPLMRTGLVLRPGVPAILGGPGTGTEGEVYAIIVTTR